jgi:hypothetical protein
MTLGANFCTIASGEGGFVSTDEINMHLAHVNSEGAERLRAKVQMAMRAVGEG